jgi:hypothetical protein
MTTIAAKTASAPGSWSKADTLAQTNAVSGSDFRLGSSSSSQTSDSCNCSGGTAVSEVEPNDPFATAQALPIQGRPVSTSFSITGSLSSLTDVDYFKEWAFASSRIEVCAVVSISTLPAPLGVSLTSTNSNDGDFAWFDSPGSAALHVEIMTPTDDDWYFNINLESWEPYPYDVTATYTMNICTQRVDLAVDSDNTGIVDRTAQEEDVEDKDGEPGKVIASDVGVDEDHDEVPDFADGYNRDGVSGNADDSSDQTFQKLIIEIPQEIDLTQAKIDLYYDCSDPSSVTVGADGVYAPSYNLLRIWTKDGDQARSMEPANAPSNPGDYVPWGEYTGAQLGLSNTNRTVTLYVEAINGGQGFVTLAVDPDGSQAYVYEDTVRITSIDVDLDVNNNASLYDDVDRAFYYLPGYEGKTPKISTGTTFNAPNYVGQAMQIIANGAGSYAGIDAVQFQISYSTQLDGYAGNASDPTVEGSGHRDDYSFNQLADDRSEAGTVTSDWASVDFWAKDYGGAAVVQVTIQKDGRNLLTVDLEVPIDSDSDGLADSWERAMVKEWNTQFGASNPVSLGFYSPDDDDEPVDPDGSTNTDGGTDMPAAKAAGDSFEADEEYRGFILDGGHTGFTGGHTRLSPAFKDLLVEVDRMDGVTNMPTEANLRGVMNSVGAGFEDLTDGAGVRFYYVLEETAAAHQVFTSEADRNAWATAHRHVELGKFVHLSFADESTDYPTNGGLTNVSYGSYVMVKTKYTQSTNPASPFAFLPGLARTAAHELTHAILDAENANGFDSGEHLADPDPVTDGPDGPADQKYLMYHQTVSANLTTIAFSNPTRSQIDLTRKESVER